MANVAEARAIIVLSTEQGGEADVVTTVLALGGEIGFDRVPIVAEVSTELARDKLLRVAGPNLHPVIVTESTSRGAALVLRQPGLSEVVEELVDAATPGVHVTVAPALVGWTFGEAVLGIDTARPIGLIGADAGLRLNPAPETTIRESDQIAVIGAGPAAIVPGARRPVPERREPMRLTIEPERMRVLFVGWNWLAPPVLAEFDRVAAPGSTALILGDGLALRPENVDVPESANFDVVVGDAAELGEILRGEPHSAVVVLGGVDAMDDAEATVERCSTSHSSGSSSTRCQPRPRSCWSSSTTPTGSRSPTWPASTDS